MKHGRRFCTRSATSLSVLLEIIILPVLIRGCQQFIIVALKRNPDWSVGARDCDILPVLLGAAVPVCIAHGYNSGLPLKQYGCFVFCLGR